MASSVAHATQSSLAGEASKSAFQLALQSVSPHAICTLLSVPRGRSCRSRVNRNARLLTLGRRVSVPPSISHDRRLRKVSFRSLLLGHKSTQSSASCSPFSQRARFSARSALSQASETVSTSGLSFRQPRPAGTLAKPITTVETAANPRWTGVSLSEAPEPGLLAARSEMLESTSTFQLALT